MRKEIFQNELERNVIPFWLHHGIDALQGGFFTFLDRSGNVTNYEKAMWMQYRAVWMFSRLNNHYRESPVRVYGHSERSEASTWLEDARHGMQFIERVHAAADGKVAFVVTRDGAVKETRTDVYTQCYACMAYAEYGRASGSEEHLRKAQELFEYCRARVVQETDQGAIHAHFMLLLIVGSVLRDCGFSALAQPCIEECIKGILHCCDNKHRLLLEQAPFNESIVDACRMDVGHTVESMWFVLDAMLHQKDERVVHSACEALAWVMEQAWDSQYGGLWPEVVAGKGATTNEKLWWTHTDAMPAYALAAKLTGDTWFKEWYKRITQWTFEHFPDTESGEWFGVLNPDGTPKSTDKAWLWKGFFHLPRALLYLQGMERHNQ